MFYQGVPTVTISPVRVSFQHRCILQICFCIPTSKLFDKLYCYLGLLVHVIKLQRYISPEGQPLWKVDLIWTPTGNMQMGRCFRNEVCHSFCLLALLQTQVSGLFFLPQRVFIMFRFFLGGDGHGSGNSLIWVGLKLKSIVIIVYIFYYPNHGLRLFISAVLPS